jgi:hypothetical protein
MHAAGNHPAHGAAEYRAMMTYHESMHVQQTAAAHADSYAQQMASQPSYASTSATGQTPGADTTPNDAAMSMDSYSMMMAAESASSGQQSASPAAPQENVLRAAAAVVEQPGRAEPRQPAAPAATAERPQAPPVSPAPATPAPAGPAVVTEAGRLSTERETLYGARPVAHDAPELSLPRGLVARSADAEPGTEGPLDPGSDFPEGQTVTPAPELASLAAGTVPVDLSALARGAEQFFGRLEDLGTEVRGGPVLLRLAPWLVTVSVTTAALELVRWQMKRQTPRRSGWIVRPTPDDA